MTPPIHYMCYLPQIANVLATEDSNVLLFNIQTDKAFNHQIVNTQQLNTES